MILAEIFQITWVIAIGSSLVSSLTIFDNGNREKKNSKVLGDYNKNVELRQDKHHLIYLFL